MRDMNRTLLLGGLIVLALFGIADSWYLYQSAVTDTALSCDIGAGLDGCNVVAQSAYSYLFGIPLALYGVGFFTVVFALAAALLVVSRRELYSALYALGIFGTFASLVFLFIQFALIKALCIYCIASALITFLMLYLAHVLKRRFSPERHITVLES